MGLINRLFGEKNKENDETALQQRTPTDVKIICPYCFEAFDHDQVHFRSPYMVERSTTDSMDIMSDNTENNGQDNPFVRRERDDKLAVFWSRFVGDDANLESLYPEKWQYPVITPENKGRMTVNGYEFDGDGRFVNHVKVRKNMSYEDSYTRLCPHCHNPLPSDDYGKHPIYFISILGITSSGKTVYLSRLLNQQPLFIAGLVPGRAKSITKMEIVEKGKLLPGATSIGFKHPISITVDGGEGIGYYTLVLYDIAGENCMVAHDIGKGMNVYGEFIKHSSGIILLTDPTQIDTVANVIKGGFKNSEIEKVLDAYTDFIGISGSKLEVPIAVTVAKSDELREFHKKVGGGDLRKVFEDIPLELNEKTGMGAGFNLREAKAVSDEMRNFLQQHAKVAAGAPLPGFVETKFKEAGYFAVSALNCGVDMYIIVDPKTGEKRKLIDEADANKVKRMKAEQEMDANGNLVTECVVTVSDNGQQIRMTVKKDTPLVYMIPQNAPLTSLRLGEPLFWLLHNHKEMVVGQDGKALKEKLQGSNQDIDYKNKKKLINTI